jgi:hypothetical protein
MITLNSTIATLIASAFIPLIVGLLTKSTASAKLKAIVSIVLNAVQALIVSSATSDGSSVISTQTLILWVIGVATSVGSYIGVWKPVDINQKLAPSFGLGKSAGTTP